MKKFKKVIIFSIVLIAIVVLLYFILNYVVGFKLEKISKVKNLAKNIEQYNLYLENSAEELVLIKDEESVKEIVDILKNSRVRKMFEHEHMIGGTTYTLVFINKNDENDKISISVHPLQISVSNVTYKYKDENEVAFNKIEEMLLKFVDKDNINQFNK